MLIEFKKMSGAGNDFLVMDNMDRRYDRLDDRTIRKLCKRRMGVGADGLILIEAAPGLDFSMRYFNSDGKEADLCANGARCAVLFAHANLSSKSEFHFSSRSGLHIGRLLEKDDRTLVEIDMPLPGDIVTAASLELGGNEVEYGFVVVGVPHVVIISEKMKAGEEILELGRKIRYHRKFEPHGTNVNFISVTSRNSLEIRTYERGVEDETLACGTGSAASAVLTALLGLTGSPVKCLTRGGEYLKVTFDADPGSGEISSVRLLGSAQIIYEGKLHM